MDPSGKLNKPRTRRRLACQLGLGLVTLSLALAACAGEHGGGPGDGANPGYNGSTDIDDDEYQTLDMPEQEKTLLDERVISYNAALRTASLKLNDRLPTLKTINGVASASDQQAAYREAIDAMFERPAFSRRIIRWWRDTLRQGGGALNTAPVFAARVMVEGRPIGELFTASENTCPSWDNETNAFVDGDCDNGVEQHAGLLSNPGSMQQFASNMAFRRVRWVQEIFACSKFPSEVRDEPVSMGDVQYTSPWQFSSVATEPIDFQDTAAIVCANCHTSMNRLAPLFAFFDDNGQYQPTIQVMTPTAPEASTSELSHWLQPNVDTAWRYGVPVANLPELGEAMAQDPEVTQCMVARMWNFVMSKQDIVSDLATVPVEVIAPYIDQLANNGGNLKETMKSMFKGPDFIRF